MRKNLFGTDGIRGPVGNQPLTQQSLIRLGNALGQWVIQFHGENKTILIGHDTRKSCSFIKAALHTGLLLNPITIYDAQVLPTPTVSQLVQKTDLFACGIIISASHNPHQDNGIKLITKHGKLGEEDETMLTELFYENEKNKIHYNHLGTQESWPDGQRLYSAHVASFFEPNFLRGITAALDCAHGATYKIAPSLFKQFGAYTHVINRHPNGTNINHECGSVYPEQLQKEVIKHNADAGFAFDGDGDRVIAVNKNGEVKNGDDILALLLAHSNYKKQSALVGTCITNYGFERFLQQHDKKLIRAAVGDKYVVQKLYEHDLLLGGEQSGHIIMRDYLDSGDGIFTALRVLQTMIQTSNWTMNSFTTYPQVQINIPIYEKKDLSKEPIASIIATHKTRLPDGRLVVRYSGTENVLRIMVEDTDATHAEFLAHDLSHALQNQL